MGTFSYEHVRAEFDDRLLTHLQHVIYNKLRRGESMAFTWVDTTDTGNGRTSVWLHPSATLVFDFTDSATVEPNRDWLERMTVVANSPAGLHVIPEPEVQLIKQ